ncbi:aminoglycoside phosphotransferase family protein [Streptomyces sp. enrichment culture]|uniref:aminoglycoside phosphotransferase family protein n=1 Tax=Streptomyces sp. enrichment culture TaxID=1795815 RepID=UPI003F577E15
MTTFLTPRQLADRTFAAVEAAVSASRALGLTVSEPAVLHDVFSVVVHLAPSPVVARIPTVLPDPGDLAALARRQQDELDVTRWLDGQGVPVIAPSPLVPYEPVQRNGFSMTFWTFVEEDRDAEPDYVANAERVADLHAALRTYPGRPEFLSAAHPEFITDSLDRLGRHPTLIGAAELDRARREWQALEPLVRSRAAFEARFPGIGLQPLHGDSPAANVFPGVDGHRYADFELVTLGPVEWDLAALGPEHRAAYDRGARRNGARPLDEEVLRFVDTLGMIRVVATLTLVPQLPRLWEYLKPALEQWKSK